MATWERGLNPHQLPREHLYWTQAPSRDKLRNPHSLRVHDIPLHSASYPLQRRPLLFCSLSASLSQKHWSCSPPCPLPRASRGAAQLYYTYEKNIFSESPDRGNETDPYLYLFLYIYTQWIGCKHQGCPSSCGNPLKYGTRVPPPPLAAGGRH